MKECYERMPFELLDGIEDKEDSSHRPLYPGEQCKLRAESLYKQRARCGQACTRRNLEAGYTSFETQNQRNHARLLPYLMTKSGT